MFVVGNPGSTGRLNTIAQMEYLRDVQYPAQLTGYAARIPVLHDLSKADPRRARAYRNQIFGLENSQKAVTGYRAGLLDPGLMEWKGTWEKDFRATGAMRGIGWAILYQDSVSGSLFNLWINEHEVGHPAGCNPILIMDVFEHAYMIDYGLKRADYIEAFFQNINWAEAEKRLK